MNSILTSFAASPTRYFMGVTRVKPLSLVFIFFANSIALRLASGVKTMLWIERILFISGASLCAMRTIRSTSWERIIAFFAVVIRLAWRKKLVTRFRTIAVLWPVSRWLRRRFCLTRCRIEKKIRISRLREVLLLELWGHHALLSSPFVRIPWSRRVLLLYISRVLQ